MQSESNINNLIDKLDEFIRKFYLNKIIRGLLLLFSSVLVVFLFTIVLEYHYYFSAIIRKILFYGLIILGLVLTYVWVFKALLAYFNLGRQISYEKAAGIIATHFSEVQDKLINILQLQKNNTAHISQDLVLASINQKIEDLKYISFSSSIKLSANKKYFKYLIPPILVFLFILFIAPSVIKDSSFRLIHNNREFEPQAPFTFSVLSKNLRAIQFEDFTIKVAVSGDLLPKDVFLYTDKQSIKLEKLGNTHFEYKMKNLQKDVRFYLSGGGFNSRSYLLKVIPKPIINDFDVQLDFPAYIGKKREMIKNNGEFSIPQGTKVTWGFNTTNVNQIALQVEQKSITVEKLNEDRFIASKRFMKNSNYVIKVSGVEENNYDSIAYFINVIPDLYPDIMLSAYLYSVAHQYIYFNSEISDDYGLKQLKLHYTINEKQNRGEAKKHAINIPIEQSTRFQSVNYFWDLKSLGLEAAQNIEYYLEVWDNDGVNGSKSTRSKLMTINLPNEKELEDIVDKVNESIGAEMSSSIEEAKKLKEEMKKLQEKLRQKKELEWEDKKQIEDLMKRQEQLQNRINNTNEKLKQNLSQQNELENFSESILEKQQQLQEMFDELLTEDMKETMEKMDQLLDKLNQDQALDELEDAEMENKDLEKYMDRMLALFEKLKFEQKLDEVITDLDNLSEEQKDLKEEMQGKSKDFMEEEGLEKQEEIADKFEDITQDIKELEEMNNQLLEKKELTDKEKENLDKENMDDAKTKMDNIDKSLSDSKESITNNNKKKTGESQKKSSDQMKALSNDLQAMKEQMAKEEAALNIEALKQLLENILTVSFEQEQLMQEMKTYGRNSAQFLAGIKQQYKLKEDTKMLEDSLLSLSKRLAQIKNYVLREIAAVNENMGEGIQALEDRHTSRAIVKQQYVMTSLNNLALILSEILQQLEDQMASQMQGQQNCQKPGNSPKPGQGKPGQSGMPKMSEMQKSLNQQLKDLEQMMKQGKKPGKGGMSMQFAKMARQQAQIRQALEKLNESGNKTGQAKSNKIDELLKEMENTEEQLVNKQLTHDMLKRQEEILTRLLEAENAEREREKDNKRASNSGKEKEHELPAAIEEYLKNKKNQIELYKTLPPNLKPYYKDLVKRYFKTLSFSE